MKIYLLVCCLAFSIMNVSVQFVNKKISPKKEAFCKSLFFISLLSGLSPADILSRNLH